jgi:hypothetical protein
MPKYDLKDVKKIMRKDYSIGGNIDGISGLMFKYETLDKKEKELEDYIQTKIDQEVKKVLEEIKGKLDNLCEYGDYSEYNDGVEQMTQETKDLIDTYLK